jgi:acyl-CoA thioesterase YciA
MDHTQEPTIRTVLLPRDTNANGTIFGGVILSHIDLAGAVEAKKHTADHRVVTVSMTGVEFKQPVLVGELVTFYTETTRIGRTSVTVHVDVVTDRGGKRVSVTKADLTYVAIDAEGRPTPVVREV